MDDLDPTVAERVLGEYPELLDRWRQEASRPYRDDPYVVGWHWRRRLQDPAYMSEVVRQHRHLTEGRAARPDEKLARRCEEIAAGYAPVREERTKVLTDPWVRAHVGPRRIAELYDPEYLQRWLKARRRATDPYSEESLRVDQFIAVASAGGTFTVTDIETGEVTDQWEIGPQPGDRPQN
jgi:hypothetical protein